MGQVLHARNYPHNGPLPKKTEPPQYQGEPQFKLRNFDCSTPPLRIYRNPRTYAHGELYYGATPLWLTEV